MNPFIVSGIGLPCLKDSAHAVNISFGEFKDDWKESSWRDVSERAMPTNTDSERKPTAANELLLDTLANYCPLGAVSASSQIACCPTLP
jgi:hypothetical protein